ncbi:MAG: CoA pyrophosphatase [Bdellovibrionaceae bacterium]|nr:CoA pyrophosphatase [Pseudobdellovibrionaceae bacterium]
MSKTKNSLAEFFSKGSRVELSNKFSRASGVALLFCGEASNLNLLFIKRATNPRDNWSGQLAFPGGKMEEADSSLLDACLREVQEEVGFGLPREAYVGSLDDIQARKRGQLVGFYIQPFIFYLPERPELIACEDEVAEIIWVGLDHLRDEANRAEYIYDRDGTNLNFPGILFENGDVLWGLTYMMVNDLLKKLQGY